MGEWRYPFKDQINLHGYFHVKSIAAVLAIVLLKQKSEKNTQYERTVSSIFNTLVSTSQLHQPGNKNDTPTDCCLNNFPVEDQMLTSRGSDELLQ